jgi:hypothetical protein
MTQQHRRNDIGLEFWYWFRFCPKDSKGNDAMRGKPQSYSLKANPNE